MYSVLSIGVFILVLSLPLVLIFMILFRDRVSKPVRWLGAVIIIALVAGFVKIAVPDKPNAVDPDLEDGAAPSVSTQE
ncbi:MAG: hypothetical protein J7501_15095 [Bdellovibrio sp.]|nr:hypothetical protein [Bdellovibrio sp.]